MLSDHNHGLTYVVRSPFLVLLELRNNILSHINSPCRIYEYILTSVPTCHQVSLARCQAKPGDPVSALPCGPRPASPCFAPMLRDWAMWPVLHFLRNRHARQQVRTNNYRLKTTSMNHCKSMANHHRFFTHFVPTK
jgi:hypothetical protein